MQRKRVYADPPRKDPGVPYYLLPNSRLLRSEIFKVDSDRYTNCHFDGECPDCRNEREERIKGIRGNPTKVIRITFTKRRCFSPLVRYARSPQYRLNPFCRNAFDKVVKSDGIHLLTNDLVQEIVDNPDLHKIPEEIIALHYKKERLL